MGTKGLRKGSDDDGREKGHGEWTRRGRKEETRAQ